MSKNSDKLIRKGSEVLTRIFIRYDTYGKKPVDIGRGIKITSACAHTIEAIGKGYATTVTTLSEYFNITKGAVSQIISKLEKEKYLLKENGIGNIVQLKLSAKGLLAMKFHDRYTEQAIEKFMGLRNKYTVAEIETFVDVLSDIDLIIESLTSEQNIIK